MTIICLRTGKSCSMFCEGYLNPNIAKTKCFWILLTAILMDIQHTVWINVIGELLEKVSEFFLNPSKKWLENFNVKVCWRQISQSFETINKVLEKLFFGIQLRFFYKNQHFKDYLICIGPSHKPKCAAMRYLNAKLPTCFFTILQHIFSSYPWAGVNL